MKQILNISPNRKLSLGRDIKTCVYVNVDYLSHRHLSRLRGNNTRHAKTLKSILL